MDVGFCCREEEPTQAWSRLGQAGSARRVEWSMKGPKKSPVSGTRHRSPLELQRQALL